jgi:hypothetical protein
MPQYALYKNHQGVVLYNLGIHPGGVKRAKKIKKALNNRANHLARAETNRARVVNKNNPTWHGTGRHAGLS